MSIYRESYKPENVLGPGDGRPTAWQVIKDEGLEGTLTDKVILITGTSSGIGIETARALAATGALVFLGVRNLTKAIHVHADILSPHVRLLEVDISSLSSVREAAAQLLAASGNRLNLLINNAGVLAVPSFHTADGLESQMAVHYWGPFLLFQLLKSALLSCSTATFPSRVVNVSSEAHQVERIDFSDLHVKAKKTVFDGYGRSKLAQVYLTNEIERRYGGQGLHAYSLHPGAVLEGSGIDRHVHELVKEQWQQPYYQKQLKSAAQGAATTVWAAVSKEALVDGVTGKYLEDCAVAGPSEDAHPGMESGYAAWAYAFDDAKSLWELSFEVVGFASD
ncbi:hypothetical protein B0O99DRAFT_509461 [Bisporella sp. PMI_857]|nr:hypothetical protein B0O99DRAFT_509461 [Bisporella sp. PMI_857]